MIRFLTLLVLFSVTMIAGDGGTVEALPGAKEVKTDGGGIASMLPMFLMIGGMILFMWLFIIRPQKKEEKRKKELLNAMKKGDDVETIGGLRGMVDSVGEQIIQVRLGDSPSIVVPFSRAAVHRNLTQEAATAAATAKK